MTHDHYSSLPCTERCTRFTERGTFTLTVDLAGAAFDDNDAELRDLLHQAGRRIGALRPTIGERGVLRDSNGNTCGAWSVA